MTDLSWKLPQGRFNFRVAAVIQAGDKVLAAHDEGSSYCYLPGGRVSLHEDTRTALGRELAEELQEPCMVGALLWVHENFFVHEGDGERFHELCFYYQVTLGPDSTLPDREEFTTAEGLKTNGFRWINLSNPGPNLLHPAFLAEKLARYRQAGDKAETNAEQDMSANTDSPGSTFSPLLAEHVVTR